MLTVFGSLNDPGGHQVGNGCVWSDARSSRTDGTSSVLSGDGQSPRNPHRLQEEMQFLNYKLSLSLNDTTASLPPSPLKKFKKEEKTKNKKKKTQTAEKKKKKSPLNQFKDSK